MVSFPTLSRPQTTRASRFLMIYNVITGVFGLIFVFASFIARNYVPTVRSLPTPRPAASASADP